MKYVRLFISGFTEGFTNWRYLTTGLALGLLLIAALNLRS